MRMAKQTRIKASNKKDIAHTIIIIDMPREMPLGRISNRFPKVRMEIISLLPIESKRGMFFIQINDLDKNNECKEFINKMAKSVKAKIIFEDQQPREENISHMLFTIEIEQPWILNQLMELKIPLRYPIVAQNGKLSLEIIALRKKIDQLLTNMESRNLSLRLQKIGKYHVSPILNTRQRELLLYLNTNGYFDIPRKHDLTQLSKDLEISASALSESIRRITKKIVRFYFSLPLG